MTSRTAQPPLSISLDPHPAAKPAGITSILVGVLVLIGWKYNVSVLQSVLPELARMQANSAVAFILLGASLLLSTVQRKGRVLPTLGRLTALAAGLIAAATLAEYAFEHDFGIDQLLFKDLPRDAIDRLPPGRMSPATAISILLLATSLELLSSASVLARRVVQFIVLASLVIATLSLVGYAYGFEELYKVSLYSSMPVHTAATCFLLCIGLLYTRADFGIMAPIRSANMGGLLARQMLPAVLGIPLLLGWMRLVQGQQLGEHGFEIGITIHTVTTIIVFAVLVWLTARSMNEIDSQREEARKAEHEMRILSEVDPLTGVLNRRSLSDRMEREWSRSVRHNRPLAALMLDIDFFKKINDTHGHVAGDAILRSVAVILLEQCRPSDLVCRYGGDEFCIIIPDATEAGTATLAERLREAFAERLMHVSGQSFVITGSFGVAERSAGTPDGSSLIEQADQALLAAKSAGRDCVVRTSSLSLGELATPQRA